ncbi:MAG TPA: flagellar assembly protein FliW [Gemmatimonadales bacterium]|jgi:flagellar assembly factor FliW|nr:flagellar assembly protein FliW [Gemmatimonadales bacterium]
MTAVLPNVSSGTWVVTRLFGRAFVADEDVIVFADGIPGFPDAQRFTLFQANVPALAWLQSLDDLALTFLMVQRATLPEPPHAGTAESWAIVTLPHGTGPATANLQAPVLIDMVLNLGRQVVQTDSPYGTAVPFDLERLLAPPRPTLHP